MTETMTDEIPFAKHALLRVQNVLRGSSPSTQAEAFTVLALGVLAEYDLRTGNGVPYGYTAKQVRTVTGGAESTVLRRLRSLAERGEVERRRVRFHNTNRIETFYRPLEFSPTTTEAVR